MAARRATIERDGARQLLPEQNTEEHATLWDILSWCFTGMSGWWALNVITAELPFFISALPEAELLGNLLAVCTQIGNVFPIIYKSIYRNGVGRLTYVIAGFQALAACILFVCAAFWHVQVAGHSMVLLLCTCVAGGCGCISNVTYWAVAAWHPAKCTQAMSVGMTLGGLLAVGLSGWQMAGRNHLDPRFSATVYFLVAGIVQLLQALAFLTQSWAAARRQRSLNDATANSSVLSNGVVTPPVVGHAGVDPGHPRTSSKEQPVVSGGQNQASLVLSGQRSPQNPSVISARAEAPSLISCYAAESIQGADDQQEEEDFQGFDKSRRSFFARVLLVACFFIYGATYAMPTLQPFTVTGYTSGTDRQQLLLRMIFLQNAGDVLGRMCTCCAKGHLPMLIAWSVILFFAFAAFCFLSVSKEALPNAMSYAMTGLFLPGLCGVYYFSRGLLVTSLYLKARLLGSKAYASRVSSNMGFLGQMGALSANVVTFVLANAVNVWK